MADMESVIIAKADELTADDLLSGPITITVTGVEVRPGTERPVTIHYERENGKPFKPCKTVSRLLVAGWGPDSAKYAGRHMTLYRDASVKWGGMEVGGIRVAAMSNLDKPLVMALTATKGNKRITTVQPLTVEHEVPAIDRARAAIQTAPDLDTLKRIWASKAMAPFREELQPVLDAQKAALTPADEGGEE